MSAPLQMLLTDRKRPQSLEHLQGWLGSEGVARIAHINAELRYVLIVTRETGQADPKYVHAVELVSDLEQLGNGLLEVMQIADQCVTAAAPIPIDIRFGLEPSERDLLNLLLDKYESRRLLRATVGGRA